VITIFLKIGLEEVIFFCVALSMLYGNVWNADELDLKLETLFYSMFAGKKLYQYLQITKLI
jgi:hypothetical protein